MTLYRMNDETYFGEQTDASDRQDGWEGSDECVWAPEEGGYYDGMTDEQIEAAMVCQVHGGVRGGLDGSCTEKGGDE